MPPKRNQKKSNQTSKTASKVTSKVSTPQPPGTPTEAILPKNLATVIIGINFGQTASSIAVINKDGTADCIANDDGDRQIPSVVSFSGAQTYVGNPARLQLIRNPANTVVGFRNLLGKRYNEVKSTKSHYNSASLVDHCGEPAYIIKPDVDDETDDSCKQRTLTVKEITTIYLKALLIYAEDFIGRKVDAAVLSVPEFFTSTQNESLRSIVQDLLGVKVLQLVSPAGAAVAASNAQIIHPKSNYDYNTLVVDVGGTSTTATVLCCRSGLILSLATCTDPDLGGNNFEHKLMEYFTKEFNKKNKTTLDLADEKAHKSMVKLRLATEITKKALSASNSANCSVDSLFDGYDFSGNINRMRSDLLLGKLYARIVTVATDAIAQSGLHKEEIQEIVLIGGSAKIPAILDKLCYALPSGMKVRNTVEPDEAIAFGCAYQAALVVKRYPLDSPKAQAEFQLLSEPSCLTTHCLSKPLGLLLPASGPKSIGVIDGKQFVTLLPALTPLPVKRTFIFPPFLSGQAASIPLDLWQGQSFIETQDPQIMNGQNNPNDDDEEEEEAEMEKPVGICVVKPQSAIAHVDSKPVKANERVTITITIENGKGAFLVSTGSADSENQAHAEFLLP